MEVARERENGGGDRLEAQVARVGKTEVARARRNERGTGRENENGAGRGK